MLTCASCWSRAHTNSSWHSWQQTPSCSGEGGGGEVTKAEGCRGHGHSQLAGLLTAGRWSAGGVFGA